LIAWFQTDSDDIMLGHDPLGLLPPWAKDLPPAASGMLPGIY